MQKVRDISNTISTYINLKIFDGTINALHRITVGCANVIPKKSSPSGTNLRIISPNKPITPPSI